MLVAIKSLPNQTAKPKVKGPVDLKWKVAIAF